MHRKNIKLIVRKQLKKEYPNWKRLNGKKKKEIARLVLKEVFEAYDFNQEIEASLEELVGIEEQLPTSGIMNLEEMACFIDDLNSSTLIKLSSDKRSSLYIRDKELRFIDELLDNRIINRLLSYNGYSPYLRNLFPCNLFRAELLKALKYSEISYRKYCDEEYIGRDRKQNRVFIGLPLHKNQMIDHTQLSQFRSSLT
ncbi:MAG: transposase, partial [Patescibacteria group bacterium]|nr:transposase [Patescibacteria group bacterium]